MIDWLEEILSAAGQQVGAEEPGESLMLQLTEAGTALPYWMEYAYGRCFGSSPETAEIGETDGGMWSQQSRNSVTSALQSLYRQSDPESELKFLRVGSNAGSALWGLYRQVSETVSKEPVSAGSRMNMVIEREESPMTAGFSMGELDRAARRDSRRYDGGMSIY